MFGSLVKQYHLKQTADKADWLIGEGLLAAGINGKGLRSMSEPGTAYDDPLLGKDPQPAHMKDSSKRARITAASILTPASPTGRFTWPRRRSAVTPGKKPVMPGTTRFAIAIWRRMRILMPSQN